MKHSLLLLSLSGVILTLIWLGIRLKTMRPKLKEKIISLKDKFSLTPKHHVYCLEVQGKTWAFICHDQGIQMLGECENSFGTLSTEKMENDYSALPPSRGNLFQKAEPLQFPKYQNKGFNLQINEEKTEDKSDDITYMIRQKLGEMKKSL